MPPTEDHALTGGVVYQIVSMLIDVHEHPEVLADVDAATTSCTKWATTFERLIEREDNIYIRQGEPLSPNQVRIPNDRFPKIAQELRNGKAVLVAVKLPGSTDHYFTIVPGSDGENARVLHAWQNSHGLRAEKSMPIDDLVSLLKELPTLYYTRPSDVGRLRVVREELWGPDHRELGDIGTSSRKRISYNIIASGKPKQPLVETNKTLEQLTNALSEWSNVASGQRPSLSDSSSIPNEFPEAESGTGRKFNLKVRYAAGFGAALGFVLGAGGALINHTDWGEVLEEGLKTGVAVGAAEAASAAIVKKVGASVLRSNAAAGVVFFGVFALWDVAKWAKHDITAVELRKRIAAGAGGAAGGVIGGVAGGEAGGALAGALAGAEFGPVGVAIGGLIGGIAAGIGGAYAGGAIDKAIWSEDEDSVMNSYEFFGWHDVKRNTRPVKSADEVERAYQRKLNDKPSKVEDNDWATYCTATLMVLLRAMFSEFKELLKFADSLHNANSEDVSFIGTAMYTSLISAYTTDEIDEYNFQSIEDGVYLIENVETQRYLFQDGEPIKGSRGDECGWLAVSGFESPKVVGSDANYYNRAYWKVTYIGDGKYFIENVETQRYLFQDGQPILGIRGDEGGWLSNSGFESPRVVGADANYYNRAYWYIQPQGDDKYFIENSETKRYLFQDGERIKGERGAEGGWKSSSGFESPKVVGADANYYNRAYYKFIKVN